MNRRIAAAWTTAFLLAIAATASGGEVARPEFLSRPTTRIELDELEELRQKLRAAEVEIERITSGQPVLPVSYFQADGSSGAGGGSAAGQGGDLARKSQNPISDLVSLPLQSNFDIGFEPGNRTRYVGNLQPVVPVKLNEQWNLVNRIIVPFVNAPIGPDNRSDGIGDSIGQFFFSPRKPDRVIWGVGPVVLFPSATDSTLGVQEWGVGITGVALISEGPIVTGAVIHQIWSVDGATKPFFLQPFFNYNLSNGWFLSTSGEFIADWELPDSRRRSIILGGGIGRVFPVFGQPMNVSVRFAPYLERPQDGPDWQFRLQVVLLFPK